MAEAKSGNDVEIFELIFAAIEMAGTLFEGCLAVLELVGVSVDTVAWVKSEPNRRARREAKREGRKPPARDLWTLAFLVITWVMLALVLTTIWLIIAAESGWWPYDF